MLARLRLLGGLVSATLLLACGSAQPAAPRPAPTLPPTSLPVAATNSSAGGPSTMSGTTATAPAAAAPAELLAPVRVGTIGSSSDAGIYIALERGYFLDEGLEIEMESIRSATAAIATLGTGALDVAGGGLTAGLFNALRRNVPIRLVADKGSLLPGFGYEALMVRRDLVESGRYGDYRDLKGLKIAVNSVPSIDSVLLARAMELGGLTLADAEVVEIAFPDQLAAYGNRAIDASLLIEPFVARVVDAGLADTVTPLDRVAPGEEIAALLYGARLIDGSPETGRRFMVGYLRGVRDYNEAFAHHRGKDDIVAVLTKHTTIKETALWQRIVPPGLNPDGSVSRASIQRAQDFFAANGLADRVEVDQLVDDRFVQYALQRLGPYQR